MNPRQGKALLRRVAVFGMFFAFVATGSPAPARAETASPSPAARIAHAEFLPYMDPPPGEPATVCLVDTGVDLNPDTESNVVSRIALDGGDGGDVWDRKHGTEMVMAMGAPINGWGTVGAWPLVRIVSVRVMRAGDGAFPFNEYAKGILQCLKRSSVRVINLSFAGSRPSDEDLAEFDDIAIGARRAGVSIIAGAGNSGLSVEYPAADPNVLAVAAAGDEGLCAFSGRGPELRIAAPGCGLELADPASGAPVSYAGTSPAAAFTSAVLAALRTYRPDLSPGEAEDLVAPATGGDRLDVSRTFRAAGLGAAVDDATARMANEKPGTGGDESIPADRRLSAVAPVVADLAWPAVSAASPWPRPRIRQRHCKGRNVRFRLGNRAATARVLIRLYDRHDEFGGRIVKRLVTTRSDVSVRRNFDYATFQYFGDNRPRSTTVRSKSCRGER